MVQVDSGDVGMHGQCCEHGEWMSRRHTPLPPVTLMGISLAIVILGQLVGIRAVQAGDRGGARYYSQGVHAFYQGRYDEAIERLDLASSYDSRDPRIYMFRGLAKQRAGRVSEASADFQMGSQVEAATKNRKVGWALQRIQGPDRLKIERFRIEAKKLPAEMVQRLVPPVVVRPVSDTVTVPPHRPIVPRSGSESKSAYRINSLSPDATDPFADQRGGLLLGRGEISPARTADDEGVASSDREDLEDAPFGSGVAELSDDADIVDQADDFAADGDEFGEADATDDSTKPGIFGAAIRAFSRTVKPVISPTSDPTEPGTDGQDDGGEDIFGDGEFDDGEFDDGGLDDDAELDDDLFGDVSESDADESDELGDPFADDGEGF